MWLQASLCPDLNITLFSATSKAHQFFVFDNLHRTKQRISKLLRSFYTASPGRQFKGELTGVTINMTATLSSVKKNP